MIRIALMVIVLVLGLARPHILPITAKITERANALQRGVRARFARKGG